MAISNDGFTPNHLLQQMYGTKDVDIELGDEELELIAGASKVVKSYNSDVIVDGRRIISLNTVLQYENDHNKLIQVIKQQFSAAGIPISDLAAGVLSDQLRHQAPRVGKRQHRGFILNPSNGRLCFLDTPGCSPNFILQG
ncbi:hypothetical protein [[Phormidium ambiguum] IAM M-71]|nr:hypothetical protein [Phormidium ambiguum]